MEIKMQVDKEEYEVLHKTQDTPFAVNEDQPSIQLGYGFEKESPYARNVIQRKDKRISRWFRGASIGTPTSFNSRQKQLLLKHDMTKSTYDGQLTE